MIKARTGAPFGSRGHHLCNCSVGSESLGPHRSVLVRLDKLLKAVGAHVDVERACPELYRIRRLPSGGQQTREAMMDVVSIFSGSTQCLKADVTIWSPFNQTCIQLAANSSAKSAGLGEITEKTRYGDFVLPLSFEKLGRLGYVSHDRLATLRGESRKWGKCAYNINSTCTLETTVGNCIVI